MNKFIIAIFICLICFPAFTQENSDTDSTTLRGRESLKTDVLFQKAGNYYTQKNDRALFFIPFAGWNLYDKMFVGAGIFTNPVKETSFRFRFFPSWSFGADRLQYAGRISMRFNTDNIFTHAEPYIRAQSSGYDLKMRTVLNYHLFQAGIDVGLSDRNSEKEKPGFRFSWRHVSQEQMQWDQTDSMNYTEKHNTDIFELTVRTNALRFADINRQEIQAQFNSKMLKASVLAFHRLEFGEYNNSLEMRFFAGGFLYNTLPSKDDFRFRLSGVQGTDNYTYDLPYLSRSETGYNFFTNQIYPGDGFFKTTVPLGQSWDWLVALNLRVDFPWKIPLQIYFDVGTYKHAGTLYQGNTLIPWNGGISLLLWKDYIEIFIPLLMSEDIKHIYEINSTGFFDRISWMIRFDEMNPFKLLKK